MNSHKKMSLLKDIASDISERGGTTYFVGGYVRDQLLGKESKDIDVEIHGISVKDTKQILESYGNVDTVGASFGVLMLKGVDIDFAFPRKESKVGSKHTDFEVQVDPFLDIREAVRRRDFTMNSILQNVLTGEYVDLFNGREDIDNKLIKVVDEHTFVEDALRPLRACQFSSRLGFEIDHHLLNLSKGLNYSHLSRERIMVELDKALLSDKPSVALEYMYEMGILDKLIPELSALKGCPQNPEFHPEGDVWNHTMLVVDEGAKVKHLSKNPRYFMYACLLHDIGKPDTTKEDEKGILRSIDHETVGAEISKKVLKRLTTEKDLVHYVSKLTEYHMKAHKLMEIKEYKVKKMMLDVDMHELLLLNKCDISGRDTGAKTSKRLEELEDKQKLVSNLSVGEFGKITPLFKGKDLIELGFKPGKELGVLLENTFELQLQGKNKEEITTILKNKLNKNKNPKTSESEYLDRLHKHYVGKDKKNLKLREGIYKRFFELFESKHKNIKLKRTKDMKLPYVELFVFDNGSKYKVFVLPDMLIQSDLRMSKFKVMTNSYYDNYNKRTSVLKGVLSKSNIPDTDKPLFIQSFKKLSMK